MPLSQITRRKVTLIGACLSALVVVWSAKNGVFEGINPFTRSRQERERITCITNLHALASAMEMYQDDHNDYFPPAPAKLTTTPYGWADALMPYIRDAAKLRCPSDTTPHSSNPTRGGYTSYWFNGNLYGQKWANVATSPVLFGEGGDGQDIADARYVKSSLPAWVDQETGPAVRHLEGTTRKACYIWAGGVAKWLTPRDARQSIGSRFKTR